LNKPHKWKSLNYILAKYLRVAQELDHLSALPYDYPLSGHVHDPIDWDRSMFAKGSYKLGKSLEVLEPEAKFKLPPLSPLLSKSQLHEFDTHTNEPYRYYYD
jgi:hypothetical protein